MTSSTHSGLERACLTLALASSPPPRRQSTHPRRSWLASLLAGAALFGLSAFAQPATAQNAVFDTGDTVVTGFSGIKPPEGEAPPAGNPLDGFAIDTEGASMKVFKVGTPAEPRGQVLQSPAGFTIPARDVGQVFAVTLEDSPDGITPPNIYLGAASVFGLNIVVAGPDGQPLRSKTGAPGATWMDGQFGTAKGGTPGSIYRVDSATGQVALFATLPGNSGAGVGDVVFDKATRQVFASDLDTGLIHRIDASGAVLDSFDHGTMGRPAAGLAPLPDDASAIDLTNPAFDTTNPATWGFTPRDRMVWGMTVHAGRLYYAVQGGPEIWSVGISLDGAFANDARPEFKVDGMAQDAYISDMLFDAKGLLYLAQRGEFRGSYDYSVFAEPLKSEVLRYRQEMPDDPATPGIWVPVPESYAIGSPEGYKNASGGIAIGNCDARTLWTTGDNLRNNPAYADQLGAGGPLDVHGLQGNSTDLVRPQNEPPFQSVFLDYDGQFGDPEKAGHVGDVEKWAPCKGESSGYYIPPYGELPPGYTPPSFESFNLELKKRATPRDCWRAGALWHCLFTIRVRNTGPTAYLGPVSVHDHFPALPAGSTVNFAFQPPWNCGPLGGDNFRCDHPPVYLLPGDSIDLYVLANMPVVPELCHVPNVATIDWPGGWGDANPADDSDWANAHVPARDCDPHGDRTDLKMEKFNFPGCFQHANGYRCGYLIKVTNVGPGQYNGQIRITDTVPAGTTATFSGGPLWDACPGGPATYTCTRSPQTLNPGQSVFLVARVDVPMPVVRDLRCHVKNDTKIILAPGGSAQNTNPANDDASATANIPLTVCNDTEPRTNLKLEKRAGESCVKNAGGGYNCRYSITVTNTGPGVYNGQLTVQDTIPAGTTANFAAGWACADANPVYTCSKNVNLLAGATATLNATINVPENVGMHLQCHVLNRARITVAPGGTPTNTNPTDDADSATANIPDLCHAQPRTNLRIEKRAGTCSRARGGWECPYTIVVQNTGPGAYNDTIELAETLPAEPVNATWNAPWNCTGGGGATATCTHPQTNIPPMSSRILELKVTFSDDAAREHNCHMLNRVRITHAPGGTPANTNPGDDNASATATVPPMVCVHTVPVVEPPICPPGFIWNGSRCLRPGCPPRQYMSHGHCCPFGSVWNGERCGKADKPDCPPRTHGKYPNCIPNETPQCPPNWTGKPPVCCPPGERYRDGQCIKPQNGCDPGEHMSQGHCCPRGEEWNGQACNRRCPVGTHGRYPLCLPDNPCKPGQYMSHGHCCPKGSEWNARRQSCGSGGSGGDTHRECPKGMHGKYPLCVPDVRDCPKGTHGKPPRCIPDARPHCPEGTVGRYPLCKQIERKCPAGMVGRPPHCRQIERKCPKGMIGTPPNCRSIGRICPPGTVSKHGTCVDRADKPKINDILKLQKDRVERLRPRGRPEVGRQFQPQINRMPQSGPKVR